MHEEQEDLSRLMSRYQSGDPAALEELYHRARARVLHYLLSLTLNRSSAEDLLQETFLQLHRSRRTYQPGRPVLPWILGIARHVMLMNRRSEARRTRILVDHDSSDLPEIPVPAGMEQLADRELVQQALRQLSADQREALVLHHVWGLSYGEIGSSLGVLAGTVKLRAFRGLQQMRQILGPAVTSDAERANR
jgi:RNA polymerase sigma-70 factor (ECF subfamily)